MIVTENMTIKGRAFVRTYSDSGYMVERDGVSYNEAIDPAEFGRTYTESNVFDNAEATEDDYQSSLRDMGVEL